MRIVLGAAAAACLILAATPDFNAAKAQQARETQPANVAAVPPSDGPATDAARGNPTAATLQELNDQAAILEVTARIAKARKEIADAEKASLATGAGLAAMPTAPGASELPAILVISGSGRNITAEIAWPTGGVAVVHAGSVLRDIGRVASISENGVAVVAEGGEHITLPFRSEGSPSRSALPFLPGLAPVSGASLPMPPIPPRPSGPPMIAGGR
jgi:type IV pilus biogenesis protein PilP